MAQRCGSASSGSQPRGTGVFFRPGVMEAVSRDASPAAAGSPPPPAVAAQRAASSPVDASPASAVASRRPSSPGGFSDGFAAAMDAASPARGTRTTTQRRRHQQPQLQQPQQPQQPPCEASPFCSFQVNPYLARSPGSPTPIVPSPYQSLHASPGASPLVSPLASPCHSLSGSLLGGDDEGANITASTWLAAAAQQAPLASSPFANGGGGTPASSSCGFWGDEAPVASPGGGGGMLLHGLAASGAASPVLGSPHAVLLSGGRPNHDMGPAFGGFAPVGEHGALSQLQAQLLQLEQQQQQQAVLATPAASMPLGAGPGGYAHVMLPASAPQALLPAVLVPPGSRSPVDAELDAIDAKLAHLLRLREEVRGAQAACARSASASGASFSAPLDLATVSSSSPPLVNYNCTATSNSADISGYMAHHALQQHHHALCMGAVAAAVSPRAQRGGSPAQRGGSPAPELTPDARAKLADLMAIQQLQLELQDELLQMLPAQ